MRCDECKHWDFPRKHEHGHIPKEINECLKGRPLWHCKEFVENGEYIDYKIKDEFKDLKLFVQDGSDYHAVMLTKADFFCAHFEQK